MFVCASEAHHRIITLLPMFAVFWKEILIDACCVRVGVKKNETVFYKKF